MKPFIIYFLFFLGGTIYSQQDTIVYSKSLFDSLLIEESYWMSYLPAYETDYDISLINKVKKINDTTFFNEENKLLRYISAILDDKERIAYHVFTLEETTYKTILFKKDTLQRKKTASTSTVLLLDDKHKLSARVDEPNYSFIDVINFEKLKFEFSNSKKVFYVNPLSKKEYFEGIDAVEYNKIKLHVYKKPGSCSVANYLCDDVQGN